MRVTVVIEMPELSNGTRQQSREDVPKPRRPWFLTRQQERELRLRQRRERALERAREANGESL